MLDINMSDVIDLLQENQSYLIALGVILAVGLIAIVACLKLKRQTKYLIRSQSVVAMILAITIVLNLFCTGPMYTILSLVSGEGTLTDQTAAEAEKLGLLIAQEGITLLQNDDDLLPLDQNSNVNVFGWASTNPVYGGTGSGSLNSNYHIVTLLEGLQNAGFHTNEELSTFYTNYRADRPYVGMWSQDWTLPEPAASTYPESLIEGAKSFSNVALVVISRSGGEQIDLPQDVSTVNYTNNSEDYEDFPAGTHYLQLTQSEQKMLDLVCSNFDDVVLVFNSANVMELGFVRDYEQIKSVIWCPGTGQNGFNALGEILSGEVNPSAKTSDTFPISMANDPYYNNFGDFTYENMDEFQIVDTDPYVPGALPHFVNYVENIYVGYKFFETAADEGLIQYDDEVLYPFGHGLSYTTFRQELVSVQESGGEITVTVKVTNTGSQAGKDVVQVYFNPPYTNGGIEKATANLIGFEKTELLAPGASETLEVRFLVEDMASFDSHGYGCYVLEEGEYVISINENSHVEIDSQIYTVDKTVVYDENNARSTDLTAATTQFDIAKGEVEYLSRADGFANYASATAAPVSMMMSEADKAHFTNNYNWKPEADPNDVMPTTGANNGVTVDDLIGKDYDDPLWEDLLDNVTVEEMVNAIALGGYQSAAMPSIGKVATTDCDGPAALNNNFTGVGSIGFPCNVMIACTWNQEMAEAYGNGIGQMADEMNVSGWYAPSVNIHRTPFSGRNFEYYSEDGFLTGKLSSTVVATVKSYGVFAYVKHFALNDQETNRWEMICTWSDEQAIREIYLKPFEACVKEGGTTAIMSSYNYIGSEWAGACDELLINVLRKEWGFQGTVLSDYFADFGYMDATRAIYNGGDTCLINRSVTTNYVTDLDNPTTVKHMREAMHNIIYTGINSRAHYPENIHGGLMTWQIILIAVDVAIGLALVFVEWKVVPKGYAKRKVKVEVREENA